MPADPLDPILTHAGVDTPLAHYAEIEAIAQAVSPLDPDGFMDASTRVCGLSWDTDQPRPPDYYEIHRRHWWIDLTHSANRRQLLNVVAAAALVDALDLTHSITWVAKVTPTAFTIESASFTDRRLQLHLNRRPAPALPPELQNTLNPADYADFLHTVRNTTELTFSAGTIHICPP
jgi:hypothetical protein